MKKENLNKYTEKEIGMIMMFLNNSIKNTGGYKQEFPCAAGGSAQWPGFSRKHLYGPHSALEVKCPLIGSCT